jgi:hypothetical protein
MYCMYVVRWASQHQQQGQGLRPLCFRRRTRSPSFLNTLLQQTEKGAKKGTCRHLDPPSYCCTVPRCMGHTPPILSSSIESTPDTQTTYRHPSGNERQAFSTSLRENPNCTRQDPSGGWPPVALGQRTKSISPNCYDCCGLLVTVGSGIPPEVWPRDRDKSVLLTGIIVVCALRVDFIAQVTTTPITAPAYPISATKTT